MFSNHGEDARGSDRPRPQAAIQERIEKSKKVLSESISEGVADHEEGERDQVVSKRLRITTETRSGSQGRSEAAENRPVPRRTHHVPGSWKSRLQDAGRWPSESGLSGPDQGQVSTTSQAPVRPRASRAVARVKVPAPPRLVQPPGHTLA